MKFVDRARAVDIPGVSMECFCASSLQDGQADSGVDGRQNQAQARSRDCAAGPFALVAARSELALVMSVG